MGVAYASRLLGRVRENIAAVLTTSHEGVPQHLFHYTTIAALLGIFQESGIYMTDARFLNDISEISYGRRMFFDRLDKYVTASADSFSAAVLHQVLDFETKVTGGLLFSYSPRFFVASFCSNGNLLSQWRAYGRGCSIGFDTRELVGRASIVEAGYGFDGTQVSLRPVLYDEAAQNALLDAVIAASFDATKADPGDGNPSYLANTFHHTVIPAIAGQLKSSVFKEEQEWRLVSTAYGSAVRFRVSNGELVPFVFCRLTEDTPPKRLPVTHIFLAPSHRGQMRETAVLELLTANGLPDVHVEVSGIPLRE